MASVVFILLPALLGLAAGTAASALSRALLGVLAHTNVADADRPLLLTGAGVSLLAVAAATIRLFPPEGANTMKNWGKMSVAAAAAGFGVALVAGEGLRALAAAASKAY
jgi:hypothetical protein